jgi:hypothetical protein
MQELRKVGIEVALYPVERDRPILLRTHTMRKFIASLTGSFLLPLLAAAQPPVQSNYPPNLPSRSPPTVEQVPAPRQQAAPAPGYKSVYRLLAVDSREHLFTSDANEVDRLVRQGTFRMEGIGFSVLDQHYAGSAPLYRFVRPDGLHFLSTEPNAGAEDGVRREAIVGYIDTQPRAGTLPLHAWRNVETGAIFYTADPTGEQAERSGLQYAGVVGHVGR